MKSKRKAAMLVDIAMAAVLIATMATAIVQEVPHEWLGMALFVLVTTHIVLNRKWLAALPRMRRSPLLVLQVAMLAILVGGILGMVASSLVLSKHVFGFLPALPGAAWARRVHLLCSYWVFVAAFAHAGLHMRLPRHLAPRAVLAIRIATVAAACYGAYCFVLLQMPAYLAGRIQFAVIDFQVPLAVSLARYAGAAALVTIVFHGIRAALDRAKGQRRDGRGGRGGKEPEA